MARPISEYPVLTFDCYGTLIDWETGIWDALQPLLEANERTDFDRRRVFEEFALLENALEANLPGLVYPRILSAVHHELSSRLGMVTTPALDEGFGQSLPAWPPFPDSAPALAALGESYRLVILSNVDRAGIAASSRLLEAEFDAVYTAEDIGSYKPDRRNFAYLLEHLNQDFGVGPGEVLHVAQSLFHDHVPARAMGLATAWIDRQRLSEGGQWGATTPVEDVPKTDYRFFSMAEFATAAL